MTAGERQALLRKYRLLAAWRRAKDRARDGDGDGGRADPAELRRLADEFPGALRELDLLGLVEIERRVRILEAPAGGDEAWVAWIDAYHALMREALAIKRARSARARGDGGDRGSPSDDGGHSDAGGGDRAFAAAVTRPPGGRLTVLVLRELARRFGVPAAQISAVLFPARRLPPYTL